MKPSILALPALLALLCSCKEAEDQAQGVVTAVGDTSVVRDAQAAANDLIRNASDCERVKSLYPEVTAKLDSAESQIQSEAGRTTIETLRKQTGTVAEACGAR